MSSLAISPDPPNVGSSRPPLSTSTTSLSERMWTRESIREVQLDIKKRSVRTFHYLTYQEVDERQAYPKLYKLNRQREILNAELVALFNEWTALHALWGTIFPESTQCAIIDRIRGEELGLDKDFKIRNIFFFGLGPLCDEKHQERAFKQHWIAGKIYKSILRTLPVGQRLQLFFEDPHYSPGDFQLIPRFLGTEIPASSSGADGLTTDVNRNGAFLIDSGLMQYDSMIVTMQCDQPYRQILADLFHEAVTHGKQTPLAVVTISPEIDRVHGPIDTDCRNRSSDNVMHWLTTYFTKRLQLTDVSNSALNDQLGTLELFTRTLP